MKGIEWQENYEKCKTLEMAYRQHQNKILAEIFSGTIRDATEHEDKKQNTDIIIDCENGTRYSIMSRLRTYEYIKYCDDIVITYAKSNGAKTEFAKMMDGFGDYFFYGFINPDKDSLACWLLLSCADLRAHFSGFTEESRKDFHADIRWNTKDRHEHFLYAKWLKIREKYPNLIKASGGFIFYGNNFLLAKSA